MTVLQQFLQPAPAVLLYTMVGLCLIVLATENYMLCCASLRGCFVQHAGAEHR